MSQFPENLSMWYMYAGMDGKGARLRITSRFIDDFIDGEYSLYEKNESGLGNKFVQLSSNDIVIKHKRSYIIVGVMIKIMLT